MTESFHEHYKTDYTRRQQGRTDARVSMLPRRAEYSRAAPTPAAPREETFPPPSR
jgi:hypothetical protein